MTPTQQPYDEWKHEVTLFLADHVDRWLQRALEELRKRDRAIEIAKKSIRCTCEFHKIHGSDGPCNGCVALQQIEEVLK